MRTNHDIPTPHIWNDLTAMNALAPIGFATAYRQLTPSERVFVDAYVHEAEKAAQKNSAPISLVLEQEPSQHAIDASRGLLLRPMVRAAIGERIKDIAATNDITMNMVMRELRHMAFSSIDDITAGYDDNGLPIINFERATPDQRRAIASFEQDIKLRGGMSIKFKHYDKQRALDTLIALLKDRDREWMAESSRPSAMSLLPNSDRPEAAGELYARMINDG